MYPETVTEPLSVFVSGICGRTLITVIAVPVLRFHAMPITLQIEPGSGGGYLAPAISGPWPNPPCDAACLPGYGKGCGCGLPRGGKKSPATPFAWIRTRADSPLAAIKT
jgi:hypothetical protein